MPDSRTLLLLLALLVAPAAFSLPLAPLQVASIGDFALENGQTIRDCRIAYRTYGELNATKSNVVVLLTWFAGSTDGLASLIGPDAMFDSSRFYVVTIDALGDGLSSSPSNSATQPRDTFPAFTMRDVVRTQYELLQRMKIDHVFAVAGLSMGGMQALQWMVSYPAFMDRIVAVTGSPKLTDHDLLLWKTELALLDANCNAAAMRAITHINSLHLSTPAHVIAQTKTDGIDEWMRKREAELRKLDPFNYGAQLRAMISHDIYRGAAPPDVAASIKPKLLIVVSVQDRMVNPGPARELARLSRAEFITLSGDCGHLASACEGELVKREVRGFLSR